MGRKGSLIFQAQKRFEKIKFIGTSRHDLKPFQKLVDAANGIKPSGIKSIGIHSFSTGGGYWRWTKDFLNWEKRNYSKVNNLDRIPMEHVGEWLKETCKGKSDYTLRTKASSIAKLFNCSYNAFGIKMPSKKGDRPKIKRSRGDVKNDKHFSITNNKILIAFATATGLRRCELEKVSADQIKKDAYGNVYIDFKSRREWQCRAKNGTPRRVSVLRKCYDFIYSFKLKAEDETKPIWGKVHKAMDVHSYRREFAERKYAEVTQFFKDKNIQVKNDYICRDGSGRRYSKVVLHHVSGALGHKRLSVSVKNYL